MMLNTSPATNEKKPVNTARQNVDFKVELVINDVAEVYLFHSRPFDKELSWLEYDLDAGELDFVLDDGDIVNFGAKVPDHLGKHMRNATHAMMVQMDEETGQPVSGDYFPIIVRAN